MGAFGGRGSLASRVGLLQDVLGTCPAPGLLPDLKHNRRDTSSPPPKVRAQTPLQREGRKRRGEWPVGVKALETSGKSRCPGWPSMRLWTAKLIWASLLVGTSSYDEIFFLLSIHSMDVVRALCRKASTFEFFEFKG